MGAAGGLALAGGLFGRGLDAMAAPAQAKLIVVATDAGG